MNLDKKLFFPILNDFFLWIKSPIYCYNPSELKYIYHSFKTRPGSRLEFRVLTGSSGRPNQFFFLKKSKRRRFSKKNKKIIKVNGFATGSWPGRRVNPPGQLGHAGFFLPLFFLQPSPVPAPDRLVFRLTC